MMFDPTEALHQFPPTIERNICLIVNMTSVGTDFTDDNAWRCTSGTPKKYYHIEGTGKETRVVPGKIGGSWYEVSRLRYTHTTSKHLHRLIIFSQSAEGVTSELAIVQYRFDAEPHSVENRPHGHSKHDDAPFVLTKRTVIQQIACAVKQQASNRRVIHKVEEESGGLLAHLPCDIPRNNRQVRYAREKEPGSSILELMNLQKEHDSFIQRIHVDKNSPTVILFNDDQLMDIKRFCAPDEEKQASIFSCDMTFNFGGFLGCDHTIPQPSGITLLIF